MIWALSLLLFLSPADAPKVPVPQRQFEMVARQANDARSGERAAEAIRLYREGVTIRPGWSEGWWWLGSLYYEQDRFSDAETAFTRFVAVSPNAAPAYAFLGLCEYETKDYERASKHFSEWALKGSPGDRQLIEVAFFHWALLLTREGRFFQALYLLEKKAEMHGPNPLLAEAMGLASLRIAKVPREYPPQQREMVWLAGEAAAYSSQQEYDRAQEYAAKLVAHYGQEPNVHFFRGTLYEFAKKDEQAAEEYRQELKVSPKHASAMIQLALCDLRLSKSEEAMAVAKQVVALEPANPQARRALGQVLVEAGEYQQGALELETAKRLAPDSAVVRFHLANAYRKLGRKADAEKEWAAFTSLKAKEEVFASTEEKLKGVSEKKGRTQ